jgi:hypothetical protein
MSAEISMALHIFHMTVAPICKPFIQAITGWTQVSIGNAYAIKS